MKPTKINHRLFLILSLIILAVGYMAYSLFLSSESVRRPRADANEVHLSVSAVRESNGDHTLTIIGTPQTSILTQGYFLKVLFDPTKLSYVQLAPGQPIQYFLGTRANGAKDDPNDVSPGNPNVTGSIEIVGEVLSQDPIPLTVNVPVDMVRIRFRPVTPGGSTVTLVTSTNLGDTNSPKFTNMYPPSSEFYPELFPMTVVGTTYNTAAPTSTIDPQITLTPTTDVPTVTPTITVSPTPTMSPNAAILNLRVKFSGVLARPTDNTLQVKVSAKRNVDTTTMTAVGTFTADDSGIWSGTVFFNELTQGSDYKLFIKGPKHLQKKFCANNPTETEPGTYRCGAGTLTLGPGTQNIDVSNIALPAGDVPENGVQNGVINSYDLAVVKNIFDRSDEERRAPASIAIADLNLDQYVDAQDYSLIIFSLGTRLDEED